MKIFDRYLVRELIPPFGLGLSVFTFILLMGKILRLTEVIVTNSIPLKTVALLILCLLPSLLIFIIPMSFLFAILLLYGRMSADNEILALRSAGVSLHRIIAPVFFASFFIFGATLFISCFVIPKSNAVFRQLILGATWKNAVLGLREKTFNDNLEDFIIYVDEISGSSLQGVMVSDQRRKGEKVIIFANRGELIANNQLLKLVLQLKEGEIHRSNPYKAREYQQLTFSTYDLLLSGSLPEAKRDFRVMGLRELWQEIQKQKKLRPPPYRLLIEWQQKFSIPFACIVFALVGCPLGIQNRKGTRFSGFGLSLGIILGYYAFLAFGKTMVYGGWLSAWVAMWMPNFLMILMGVYLFKKLEQY